MAETRWYRNVYASHVDVTPVGEETMHIPDPACECRPEISGTADGRLIVSHNSYDGRELRTAAMWQEPRRAA